MPQDAQKKHSQVQTEGENETDHFQGVRLHRQSAITLNSQCSLSQDYD